MNTYLSKTFTLVMFASSMLFLSGCTKSIVNIELGNGSDGDSSAEGGSTGSVQGNLVSFSASVESRNMTRALTPMQKEVANLLFAYKSPIATLDDPTEEGLYVTTSVGIMTGVRDYKMYLPNGVYTFYAVSNNTYSTPIQFTDGISHPLTNGVDYLWANNKLQDIATRQANIPIIYLHSATQVVFDITSDSSLKLNKLVSATITPSKAGGTMQLINGDITPATTYSPTPANMGINKFRAQYIMLPLETSNPMKLVLNVLINGETTPRVYSVDVPVPNGRLEGGSSYVFSAILGENTVSFADVNIEGWTDVDETGNPLYPSQK